MKLPLKAEINLNILTNQVSSGWPLVLPGDGLLALLPNDETKGQDLINLLSLQVLLVWTVNRELRGSFHPSCANNAIGGLEPIRNQPLAAAYDLFIRCIVWAFGYLLFLHFDSMHDPGGALIGFLCLFGCVLAERLGAFTENPFEDGLYGLPINRICATISKNLFSIDHPLSFTDLDLTP